MSALSPSVRVSSEAKQYWHQCGALCGKPLIIWPQIKFMLPIITLWPQLFTQLPIHLTFHLPNFYFISLSMMMRMGQCQSLAKIKVDNSNFSSLIHQPAVSLWKAITLVKHDFPFINLCLLLPVTFFFEKGFQADFHHLLSDWGEVDQPVVPQLFVLALLEGETCFLPFSRNFTYMTRPCEDNQEWSCDEISQFSQDSLCMFNLFQCSLTCSSSTKSESSLFWVFSLVKQAWGSWSLCSLGEAETASPVCRLTWDPLLHSETDSHFPCSAFYYYNAMAGCLLVAFTSLRKAWLSWCHPYMSRQHLYISPL